MFTIIQNTALPYHPNGKGAQFYLHNFICNKKGFSVKKSP